MGREEVPNKEIESVLREHFRAEATELRFARDPWPWLEPRMEPATRPSLLEVLIGERRGWSLYNTRAVAVAAISFVIAAVISVLVLAVVSVSKDPTFDSVLMGRSAGVVNEEAELMFGAKSIQAAPDAVAVAMPADDLMGNGENQSDEVEEPMMELTVVPAATAVVAKAESVKPADTTFQDSERHPYVSTSEDNVSTFSLDTDRTSYHLALNWALSGYDVDPDSVRAEEWINAFDYQYDSPLRQDSFAITSDVFEHPLESSTHLARIAIQAPEMQDDRPINVTLVLDASGSMGDGDRVSIAREAAESIRQSLRDRDRIAVVHFTTSVIANLTVKHSDPDSRDVKWSIAQLTPNNSTNVQAGLDLGVQLAERARRDRPDAYNYIILMSDGVANVDATDPFAILESVGDNNSRNPLRLITIGVGIENYNDYLLEELAQHGNGWYRYLSTKDQARATFSRNNWLALSAPFADQTRAQVTWDPNHVESWRLIGYENRVTSDQSFTQARKEFAEIPAGAATTVFYELILTDSGKRDLANLGDIEVRWVTPLTGDSNRQHSTIQGHRGTELHTLDDALLRFGAIVALSSDLYSSLPHADYPDAQVHQGLTLLQDELQLLEDWFGELDAYWDFNFLMNHITREIVDSSLPSGYSQ